MLNANNLLNDPNYTPVITEDGNFLIATEPGNMAPEGVFIIVSSTLRVRSGGNYPFEHRRRWLGKEPRYVKR